jgi:hypothetical protein
MMQIIFNTDGYLGLEEVFKRMDIILNQIPFHNATALNHLI